MIRFNSALCGGTIFFDPSLRGPIKAKDFLGMVMRGEIQATPQQIRAAENLLTIEEPKRKAEGRNYEEEFPYKLEEALRRRSERAKQVNPIIDGTVIKDKE